MRKITLLFFVVILATGTNWLMLLGASIIESQKGGSSSFIIKGLPGEDAEEPSEEEDSRETEQEDDDENYKLMMALHYPECRSESTLTAGFLFLHFKNVIPEIPVPPPQA